MRLRKTFAAAAFALLSIAAAPTAQESVYDGFIELIPRPKDGEYKTPEDLIRKYVDATNRNDESGGMKCFPIREYYGAMKFEVYLEYLGAYIMNANLPLNDFPAARFQYVMGDFNQAWFRFGMQNLIAKNMGVWYDAEKKKFKTFMLSEDAAERKMQIDDIIKMTKFANPENKVIKIVKKIDAGAEGINIIEKWMGVEKKLVIVASIKNIIEEKEYSFAVGKIGSNWRILQAF